MTTIAPIRLPYEPLIQSDGDIFQAMGTFDTLISLRGSYGLVPVDIGDAKLKVALIDMGNGQTYVGVGSRGDRDHAQTIGVARTEEDVIRVRKRLLIKDMRDVDVDKVRAIVEKIMYLRDAFAATLDDTTLIEIEPDSKIGEDGWPAWRRIFTGQHQRVQVLADLDSGRATFRLATTSSVLPAAHAQNCWAVSPEALAARIKRVQTMIASDIRVIADRLKPGMDANAFLTTLNDDELTAHVDEIEALASA